MHEPLAECPAQNTAERTLLTYPDPRLRIISTPIDVVDSTIEALAEDLLHTLEPTNGIGLSAPQLGVNQRLVLLWEDRQKEPEWMINPVLTELKAPCIVEESCLSVPGLTAKLFRSAEAQLSYVNISGDRVSRPLQGMEAVCLQHEVEHLDGVLFLDHLSRLRRWHYRRWGAWPRAAAG